MAFEINHSRTHVTSLLRVTMATWRHAILPLSLSPPLIESVHTRRILILMSSDSDTGPMATCCHENFTSVKTSLASMRGSCPHQINRANLLNYRYSVILEIWTVFWGPFSLVIKSHYTLLLLSLPISMKEYNRSALVLYQMNLVDWNLKLIYLFQWGKVLIWC